MKPLRRTGKLVLVALGALQRDLLVEVAATIRTVFGSSVVLAPAQQQPAYAFNKDRNQYHAGAILRRLAQGRGAPEALVLGITDVDLFDPETAFVFGDADRGTQSAVVSLARLAHRSDGRPADPELVRRRVAVEAVHELGHLLGLSHCQDVHCAMLLSHKASDADRKGPGLCSACRSALGTESER